MRWDNIRALIKRVLVISCYSFCSEVFLMPNYLICYGMGELKFLVKFDDNIWQIKQGTSVWLNHTNYKILLKYQISPPEGKLAGNMTQYKIIINPSFKFHFELSNNQLIQRLK